MHTQQRSFIGAALVVCVLALALAVMAMTGCAAEPERPQRPRTTPPAQVEDSPTAEPPQAPEPANLLDEITTAQYATWATAPGYESRQVARGPHGDQVQTFLNAAAEAGLAAGGAQWPNDSIIVKDVFRDGELIQIAVMKRTPDGWYWGEWEASGALIVEGLAVEPCQGCHAAGTDGTLGVDLP